MPKLACLCPAEGISLPNATGIDFRVDLRSGWGK